MLLKPSVLGCLALLLSFRGVCGEPKNATIDDYYGDERGSAATDVLFLPDDYWNDETCAGCFIKPDQSRAYRKTWKEATYHPSVGPVSIHIRFEGTAIYTFFILANNEGEGTTTLTDCNFTLDGGTPVRYRHVPDTTTNILYDQLAFSQTGLSNGKHRLDIIVDGSTDVYLNFDYAVYTYEDPLTSSSVSPSSSSKQPAATGGATNDDSEPESKSSPPIGAIVGGVVGGILLVILFGVLFYFYRRSTRPKTSTPPNMGAPGLDAQPYDPYSPTGTHGLPMQSPPYTPMSSGLVSQQGNLPTNYSPYPYVPSGTRSPPEGSAYTAAYGGITTTAASQISSDATSGSGSARRPLISHNPSSSLSSSSASPPSHITAAFASQQDPRARPAFADEKRGAMVAEQRPAGAGDPTLVEMRQQMQAMKQEIQVLKESQSSGALNPDAPPMYSPG